MGSVGKNEENSSISSQMDVSKFALDRSAYLNTAAAGALYDTTKSQSNPHSAYGASLLNAGATTSGLYQYSAAAMAANQAAGSSSGGGSSGSGGSGAGGSSGDYRRPLTVIF
uniref:Uncharacterized protein n=1 Tax=Anopheles farauti TaxID=69004 RepID=A0A182QS78_9DIPT